MIDEQFESVRQWLYASTVDFHFNSITQPSVTPHPLVIRPPTMVTHNSNKYPVFNRSESSHINETTGP